MEHDGDVYSCDHFVEPRHRLSNMQVIPLTDLVGSVKQRRFGLAKRDMLPRFCRECPVLFACHGAIPRIVFSKPRMARRGQTTCVLVTKPFSLMSMHL